MRSNSCWVFSKKHGYKLVPHVWVRVVTPDEWLWDECKKCGSLRRRNDVS